MNEAAKPAVIVIFNGLWFLDTAIPERCIAAFNNQFLRRLGDKSGVPLVRVENQLMDHMNQTGS